MLESEVARIRRQIELEYEASSRPFTDFTPITRHDFISARQENIAKYFQDLTQYMSQEEAITIVLNAENGLSGALWLYRLDYRWYSQWQRKIRSYRAAEGFL
jgi:hypothetical protein